jgi:hypothetical protein
MKLNINKERQLMRYVKFTEKEYKTIHNIFNRLDEAKNMEDVRVINEELATTVIKLSQEFSNAKHQLNMGNIIQSKDTLSVIDENGILKHYQIVKRQTKKGDIVRVTGGNASCPFNESHIGNIYVVSDEADKEALEWFNPHVYIGNSALYDAQYEVLEEIK